MWVDTNKPRRLCPERTASPIVAVGKVRYVGDHIAVVIAESLEAAQAASEKIVIDLDNLPAVVDPATAIGNTQIHDEMDDNVYFDWELGDEAATADALGAQIK